MQTTQLGSKELRQIGHEYLSRIYILDQQIEQDLIQLQQLRRKAQAIGAVDYSRVIVKSSPENTMECIIASIEAQHSRINEHIQALAEQKKEASDLIDRLERPIDRTILRYRYICLCRMDDIASRVGYDRRHVIRLCNRGLREIGEKLSPNVTSEGGKIVT